MEKSIKSSVRKRRGVLTVITPVYNRKSYLDKALNMLKAQTLADIKFILVDDGSVDGGVQFIEDFIKDDNRFSLIKNKQNIGPSAARNKALRRVKSAYVGFFDIDDEIPTDYFEKLYQRAEQAGADIVFTNYNNEEHRLTNVSCEAEKYRVLKNGAIWDKIYKTSMLKRNDITFAEKLYTADNLFNIQAFYAAKKIELVDNPRYLYELHDDSIGKDEKLITKRKKDIITICKKAIEFAKVNNFDVESLLSLRDFLQRSYNCYLEDNDFRYNLYVALRNIGIKINFLGAVIEKYSPEEYMTVERTGFFDAHYYRLHNPSLWFSRQNLLKHYLTIGWLEGKNPSVMFDGNKYLSVYPDVAKAGKNPLIHFLCYGMKEKRTFFPVAKSLTPKNYYDTQFRSEYDLVKNSGYFNSRYYRWHNPDLWFCHQDLLEHYLLFGWQHGKNPSARFDGNKYLSLFSDVEQSGVNPLVHYLKNGQDEGRECCSTEDVSGVFSAVRYALEYPMRVKEEYDRLNAEIKAMENMK